MPQQFRKTPLCYLVLAAIQNRSYRLDYRSLNDITRMRVACTRDKLNIPAKILHQEFQVAYLSLNLLRQQYKLWSAPFLQAYQLGNGKPINIFLTIILSVHRSRKVSGI